MKLLSRVRLFMTPWTVAYQAPPSMGFSRQDTGVGCHFLLQGNFPTQWSNPGFPHFMQALYPLSHQGSLIGEAKFAYWQIVYCFIGKFYDELFYTESHFQGRLIRSVRTHSRLVMMDI